MMVTDFGDLFLSYHDIAAFFIPGNHAFTDHEVLYVGVGRTPNASARLKSHSTLQKILAQNAGSDFDVFVTYVEVAANQTVAMFGMDDSSHEVSGAFDVLGPMLKSEEFAVRQAHSYAEAALISHFKPKYNTQQLSFPENRSKGANELREDGYTKVAVWLDLANVRVRMWSRSAPDPRRAVAVELNVRPGNFSATTVEKSREGLDHMLGSATGAVREMIENEPIGLNIWMRANPGDGPGAKYEEHEKAPEEFREESPHESGQVEAGAASGGLVGMWRKIIDKFKRRA